MSLSSENEIFMPELKLSKCPFFVMELKLSKCLFRNGAQALNVKNLLRSSSSGLKKLGQNHLAEKDVVFDTGCFPKCQKRLYKFSLKDETDVTWRKDWVSSFYLSTDSTTYQMSTEYYSYDIQVRFDINMTMICGI